MGNSFLFVEKQLIGGFIVRMFLLHVDLHSYGKLLI